jgi:Tfp pilus assembly protein PilO
MMLVQNPPPVPPLPPGSEMSISGSLEDVAAVVLLLGVAILVAGLLWPLIRAFARRIEGGAAGAELQAEVDSLRERVRQLEEMPPRMAELEERVDFAERVVAKGREPERLDR